MFNVYNISINFPFVVLLIFFVSIEPELLLSTQENCQSVFLATHKTHAMYYTGLQIRTMNKKIIRQWKIRDFFSKKKLPQ